jgi:hypothetical protein
MPKFLIVKGQNEQTFHLNAEHIAYVAQDEYNPNQCVAIFDSGAKVAVAESAEMLVSQLEAL